jgi:formylglycine-generating enzyme required for sulfatase activity
MGTADPATVSGFRLDKYLVTVGRFRQFVKAWNMGNGYKPPQGSGKHTHLNGGNGLNATAGGYETGWSTLDFGNIMPTDTNLMCDPTYASWTTTAGANENLPMACVNWWEAYAFCIWDGGFLPSEAEWEYAAAGGGDAMGQREYPWGNAAPGATNQYDIYGCYYPSSSGTCSGVMNIAPVGFATLGVGRWGQLDMVGNLYVYILDWNATYTASCTDCANVAPAVADRVIRSGPFHLPKVNLVPALRGSIAPASRFNDLGFRCARVP